VFALGVGYSISQRFYYYSIHDDGVSVSDDSYWNFEAG
jgi:hypothetical protein